MNNIIRTVHLGVYGDTAFGILSEIASYCKNGGTRLDERSFGVALVERAPDGEIVLNITNDWSVRKSVFGERHGDNSDAKVRLWLAGIIKGIAKMRMLDNNDDYHRWAIRAVNGWKPDDTFSFEFGNSRFTVSEFYALYDIMKGRKQKSGRYAEGALESICGKPRDPVMTELEVMRREEERRLDQELEARESEIRGQWNRDYEAINKKKTDALDKARADIAAKKAELAQSIRAAVEAAQLSAAA